MDRGQLKHIQAGKFQAKKNGGGQISKKIIDLPGVHINESLSE